MGSERIQLGLPAGDRVTVAAQGAHVLSWQTADGVERLYLSSQSAMDGQTAIRGGVPLCFPQFNQRVLGGHACPKHGFARNLQWTLHSQRSGAEDAQATFTLSDSADSRALWPFSFGVQFDVCLTPGQLRLVFSVRNTDSRAWPFSLALHTYLRVDDIARTQLLGLQDQSYWDGVTHLHDPTRLSRQTAAALTFDRLTDSVYTAPVHSLTLVQSGQRPDLHIAQSPNFPETVVWNPGAAMCGSLADMPPDGYRHMLCVEAASVNTPVLLAPGEQWQAWQQLTVAPSPA
ncbi:MAG: hypothetical protein RLZZ401_800 [Pseudomonadota bacterium]